MKDVARADACAAGENDVGDEGAILTEHDIGADGAEGADGA
jgi:hypothetical protein